MGCRRPVLLTWTSLLVVLALWTSSSCSGAEIRPYWWLFPAFDATEEGAAAERLAAPWARTATVDDDGDVDYSEETTLNDDAEPLRADPDVLAKLVKRMQEEDAGSGASAADVDGSGGQSLAVDDVIGPSWGRRFGGAGPRLAAPVDDQSTEDQGSAEGSAEGSADVGSFLPPLTSICDERDISRKIFQRFRWEPSCFSFHTIGM